MEKMVMKKNFWKNKKVLVTGHNGFKGSWLVAILSLQGANIYGVSLQPLEGSTIYNSAKINECLKEDKVIDIRNYSKLSQYVQKIEPDIIFHFAAQALVGNSYNDPIETYSTNIMGTINLIESARYLKTLRCIINVTSDKCYENKESIYGYREYDVLGGSDPYSCSKSCVELISNSYRNSFLNEKQISLVTVRAGNVIGGGDCSPLRLLPDIFRAIENNNCLAVRSIVSIRPWQHVLDPLLGYIKLAEESYTSFQYSSGWNFGPDKYCSMSVNDILIFFKNYFPDLRWKINKEKKFKESKILELDITKAQTLLNWEPKITIEEALELTINWYVATKNKYDMKSFTNAQITDYLKM